MIEWVKKTEKVWVKDFKVSIEVSNAMPEPKNWGAALFGNKEAYEVVLLALKKAYVNKLITNEEWRHCDVIKELILQFETAQEEYKENYDKNWLINVSTKN